MSIKMNNEGKQFLYKAFNEMGIEYVLTEANFIFLNLNREAAPIVNGLLKSGVIVRPCGPNFMRVTIGKAGENEKLVAGLKVLLK